MQLYGSCNQPKMGKSPKITDIVPLSKYRMFCIKVVMPRLHQKLPSKSHTSDILPYEFQIESSTRQCRTSLQAALTLTTASPLCVDFGTRAALTRPLGSAARTMGV